MKTLQTKLLTAMLTLFLFTTYAQEGDLQMFWIHENPVKPSMVMQYEEGVKQLTANMNKYNVQNIQWLCTNTSDFRYLYIMPIKNMAALDTNVMAPLFEKMGQEEAGKMFDKMNECYDKQLDYIIHLNPNLSYQPGGINQNPEGMMARKFFYIFTTPQNAGKLQKAMKGVRDLFAKKNSTSYYRVYQSGFGTAEMFYMVAIAGENPAEIEANGMKNDQLLGDDRFAVFNEVLKYASRFEQYSGQMRPDLAYAPKKD